MLKSQAARLALVVAMAGFSGAALAQDASLDLVGPLSDYKLYVAENTAELLVNVEKFTTAVKAGDIDTAKALFAPTRTSYEKIEPIAELFADLDAPIDARADDYELAEADPEFTGFHRIEYGLWEQGSTAELGEFADKLLADVQALDARITDLVFPPEVVVGGAAALMEEVAATKISGEEDRYSHTDLWDFDANFAGSKKIYDLLKPLVTDAEFTARVDANFADVDAVLDKYQAADGSFVSYEELTDADRDVLAAKVNTLAEDLATLRGQLGMS